MSECPIKLQVLVDGQNVHKLPAIKSNQTLRWDMQTYPCDVHQGSTIGLRLTEKHQTPSDREVLVKYTISEASNQTSITKDAGTFPSRWAALGLVSKRPNTGGAAAPMIMTVKFLDLNQIGSNYTDAFDRAMKMIEDTQGPFAKLGNSRETLKTILGFGAVVAELHPIAKLVIGLCTKAWEHLEKIQKQHEDLQQLIDGLNKMQPFINAVQKRAREAVLEHVVLGLLKLIEDASNFIINSIHLTTAGRTGNGFSYTRDPHRINELLEKLAGLKEQFDRGVGVQVLNQVLSTEQRAVINQLKPAVSSFNNIMPSPCHEGTRTQVIADIRAWHRNTDNSQQLLWLHGQAGMGKSSIAASICQMFLNEGTLGAHFFFKRDDPYLRSPEHMLNAIVHRLALRHEPYGRAVASAIENYSGLLDMPLGQRYSYLVEHPMQSLQSTMESPPKAFVIIVDALDECENTDNRRPLFGYLRKMSQLTPWIKIVITSRPDEDIKAEFDGVTHNCVDSRNIASYDASSDILKYTQMRMEGMANRRKRPRWSEELVHELSARASGLFIWVETACKFIERGVDMMTRLQQVLAGTQSTEGTAPLDLLYATAIKQGMGDEGPDNVRIFRECIGAVVATGSRRPLPIAGLESLLSDHVGVGVFHTVVGALGSVFYQDPRQGGAVRVYHPSFTDFILDPSRSDIFYTNPRHQNTVLAYYSLRTMMRELRFNICELKTSHILNRDVIDLEARVQTVIRPHLAYSCLHWSNHLTKTPMGTLQGQLGEFLYGVQIVYWIEAMSLLGKTSAALTSLLQLISWASDTMGCYSSYANDVYRFILTFYDAISQSTPHLYISALPFAPTGSQLAQRMQPHLPNTLVVAQNANEGWPAWLQNIRHNDEVDSVACSANGRRIISGCDDGTLQIWDSETGMAISEPLSSPGPYQLAISSNGQQVASVGEDGILRVWDVGTGAELDELFSHSDGHIIHVAFSSDSKELFCVDSGGLMLIWDIGDRVQLSELLLDHSDSISSAAASHNELGADSESDDETSVNCAAISPDEKIVATGYSEGTVRLWDTSTGNLLAECLQGHSGLINSIAFSPNGQIIATGSFDATVRMWEVNTGRALSEPMVGHSESVLSVTFAPSGRYVVSGSMDMSIRVWDVATGLPACNPLLSHTGWVRSVVFCSHGRRLASASRDRTVLIWDVGAILNAPRPLAGHTRDVRSVAFSSDGRHLASGSADGTIRIWDAQSGDEVSTPLTSHSDVVTFVAFISDSQQVFSLSRKGTVQIHNICTGALDASFTLGDSNHIWCIALSPNGQRLASGSVQGQVGLWDARTGFFISALADPPNYPVSAVIFSPNGRFIAFATDSEVGIREAETGAAVGGPLRSRSRMSNSICFSPDSRHIASGTRRGTVEVWDVETSAILFEPLPGQELWPSVSSIAFTPDGRYIIFGLYDATVRIQDAITGAAVAEPLKGHSGRVMCIALSPDGRNIATGSGDNTVRVWDIENLRTYDQLLVEELFTAPLERSVSTSVLAHYANKAGWVTSSSGALLLWLPKQYQQMDDSLFQISIAPTTNHVLLDFSRFVHGDSWVSVARGS